VSQVLEYKPAPGQFINTDHWGSLSGAQSLVGGINGHISLGAYGGYIVVGFDHSIQNDANNPYGVDFTVFGNPMTNWSEPGIVWVSKDVNANGLADDAWYELAGSEHGSKSTYHDYGVTYFNPHAYADVPFVDNYNRRRAVLVNVYHTQEYYPGASFTNVNQAQQYYTGTLISPNVDDSNPYYIQSFPLDYGYADNHVKQSGDPVTQPDNPTTSALEGAGGDAFDISWAIDAQGNSVSLDSIDFIKIQTGVSRDCGWLGEMSTEVTGVVDVAPQATASRSQLRRAKLATTTQVSFYPAYEQGVFDVYNVKGDFIIRSGLKDLKLPVGIYHAKQGKKQIKIVVE